MSIRSILRALGRRSIWASVKQLAAVTFVVTAAVTFALFSPAYRYAQSEGFRQAPFDLWVNGPIGAETLEDLRAIDPTGTYGAVADVTPRYLEAGDRRTVVSNGRFFADAVSVPLVYPGALRLAGKPFADIAVGEIIIDGQTADALGVGPGDAVDAVLLDTAGEEYRVTSVVGALVVTTAHLRSSIGGLLAGGWESAIPSDIPPFSSVFVATALPEAFDENVQTIDPDLQVIRRSDLLNDAIAQANQLVDRSREVFFLGMAMAILLVFVIRDLRALLQLRSRSAAVLIALGIRPGRIASAVVLEQLVLLAVSLAAGTALGVTWFTVGFHLPVPAADLGFLLATMVVLAAGALGSVIALVTRQLSTMPITRLLFEGT